MDKRMGGIGGLSLGRNGGRNGRTGGGRSKRLVFGFIFFYIQMPQLGLKWKAEEKSRNEKIGELMRALESR